MMVPTQLTLASDYTFTGGTHTFDVTKANVDFLVGQKFTTELEQLVHLDVAITNLAGGETLTFTGSGTVASANVQSGQSLTSNGTLMSMMEVVLAIIIT